MDICLKIPFHPNQATFGRDQVYFFFFPFFFFLIFVHSSSPKPQHIEIYFLCKVVELQTQVFLPKFFGATPPGTPQKWGPKKSIFWMAQARVPVVFDISRYLTDKILT